MQTIHEIRALGNHWSYSSLNTLLNVCPLQWAFGHFYNVERESTPACLLLGRAFHAAASNMAWIRMRGATMPTDEAQSAFSDFLSMEFAADPNAVIDDGDSLKSMDAQGRGMVAALAESWPEGENVVGVSETFNVDILDANGDIVSERSLVGESDMSVVTAKGDVAVVDWKTSARKWPGGKADRNLQPTVLLYGVSQEMGSTPSFRFDVVTKTKVPAVERHTTYRTADDFARLAELVKVADKIVEAEAFFPCEGGWECGSCPYAKACSAWHRNASRLTIPMAA